MSNEVHPVFDRLLKEFCAAAIQPSEFTASRGTTLGEALERHRARLEELERFAREENDYAQAEVAAQEERERELAREGFELTAVEDCDLTALHLRAIEP